MKVTGYVFGTVLLVALLYVGSYYATVEKRIGIGMLSSTRPPPWPDWMPGYRLGGEEFFSPMHALDRRLRPEYWGE